MALGAVIFFMVMYLAGTLWRHLKGPSRRIAWYHALASTGIFIAAIIASWPRIVGFDRWTPIYCIGGIIAGHLFWALALFLTRFSVAETLRFTLPIGEIWRFYRGRPFFVLQYLHIAVYEEVIWRATVQRELIERTPIHPAFAIALVAIVFTLLHTKRFFQHKQRFEFFVFSLILGGVYYLTGGRLLLVTMIHVVRDVNIHFRYAVEEVEAGQARGEDVSLDSYKKNLFPETIEKIKQRRKTSESLSDGNS